MIGTDGITTRRAACEFVTEVRVWVLDASFTREDNPTWGSVICILYIAPSKSVALPVTTMNARITILKSVNTWTQCHSFVRRGSKRLLAFMSRTPNRGASPCREAVKTITEAHLSRCSWMREKGSEHPRWLFPAPPRYRLPFLPKQVCYMM